jgi:hypothetical protein
LKQCLYCPQREVFNTLSRACEPCPSSSPLWRNYACEACQNGTTYNQQSNTCDTTVNSGFVNPSPTQ